MTPLTEADPARLYERILADYRDLRFEGGPAAGYRLQTHADAFGAVSGTVNEEIRSILALGVSFHISGHRITPSTLHKLALRLRAEIRYSYTAWQCAKSRHEFL
jgi:hypothetical protein